MENGLETRGIMIGFEMMAGNDDLRDGMSSFFPSGNVKCEVETVGGVEF